MMPTQSNPEHVTLSQQFSAVVEQYQTHIALLSPEQQLTYQQLNQQANQVAAQLHQLEIDIQPGQLIGLHFELSVEAIIGLWGIIKAGGAFVPLDPAYPPDRLQHILNDTQLSVILTTKAGADRLPVHHAKLIFLDELPISAPTVHSYDNQPPNSGANLACCLYTSGSTGQPKGVLLEHQALVKQFVNLQHHYQLTPDDRVLQFALLTHIAGVEQAIMALLSGAALVIPGQKLWTASEFLPKVKQYGLTMVDLPASYYQTLAQEWATSHLTVQNTPLRLLIVGGEVTSAEGAALWSKMAASQVRFLNVYGMTEVSGTATLFEVPSDFKQDWQSLPIGQPLPNRRVYIVDEQGELVQNSNESGELCIGGESLARGYLNQPALSAEKFVPNPFGDGKIYKTGDVGRFLPDHILQYIGRKDHQVQIRGFRVELGEVETALRSHSVVKETAVLAQGEGANKQLVAYIIPEQPAIRIDRAQLRQDIAAKLPDYMVPQHYLFLETFPLTANGKIDRQALPKVDPAAVYHFDDQTTFVPPKTELELTLAAFIMEQLQVDKVDAQTNFSDLGLNSLHLTQIQNRIQLTLKQELPLVDIFSHPTIQSLAHHLGAVEKQKDTTKPRFSNRAAKQKSYLQQRKRQHSKRDSKRGNLR